LRSCTRRQSAFGIAVIEIIADANVNTHKRVPPKPRQRGKERSLIEMVVIQG
jgi:hypothetical protein